MALTGIQIFKLLPKTNCGECKYPTCLAFAMALASSKAEIDACPHITDEGRLQLSEASAPPIRQVSIGSSDYEIKIGGETVLFRHEKTFLNQPGFAILISDTMDDAEIESRFEKVNFCQYDRIGTTLRPELVALKATGNDERFINLVKKAIEKPYGIVLICPIISLMKKAVEICKARKPLIYAATTENVQELGFLAKAFNCPLAVRGNGIEEVMHLTEQLTAMGVKDLVLDTSSRGVRESFQDQIIIRRAALVGKNKQLGFPTITFPCEMTDSLMKETLIASCFVAKYAGIIVLSDFKGESIFPLLLQRLNIYTDPQRPMTTEQGIYPINNPDSASPVLITCNFSLTYFIVSGEIENSRIPSWLCVMDTEGLSVLTAWAAGKFLGDSVGSFIKKCGIIEKIEHRKLIIPGYAASILGEVEEELPGWEIQVGPREAVHIPAYLKMWK
ncbi:MAG: Corrinoid/iron-sulfur protein large subunit [Deltaproteobacteria bacterium ADurb.Bin135]|nr:MAG: Corrinoid/iron-sulfur protein large subunit [Deltaproteobacteria bacterium ADurb.Bin135]